MVLHNVFERLKECLGIANSERAQYKSIAHTGLPRSGKNIWKMKFFPGQGKVREFCGWSGQFRKNFGKSGKSQGNLKINGYARQTSENLFILFKGVGKMYFLMR